MSKVRVYRLFRDDRKNNHCGWVVTLTTPRGGPYPACWIGLDGVVQDRNFPNTHSRSVIGNGLVPASYLHRRCRPHPAAHSAIPNLEQAYTLLGLYGDGSRFLEESPIKMGETYSPDAVPAN